MAITRDEFIPRPGIVNKQGRLSDPKELVCIEVPKVFDQCLIKRCLSYMDGVDTPTTDEELRSNPLNNPRIFVGCRNFDLKLTSVEKIPILGKPDYKKVVVSFVISFFADYIDDCGRTQNEFFQVQRTEEICKLYCPDSIAQISASFDSTYDSTNLDAGIIKLEMVADCLKGEFNTDEHCNTVLDIVLGVFLIVKCELIVQLLVPTYGYCPAPEECEVEPEVDPCELFEQAPVPQFFPDQILDNLFNDDTQTEDGNK
ncbi:hypothetical protein [Clostridium oryzae]|uniref:Uncharacterized protein n=1 Tax=Clostridium oryzae TaxID=1450648 RepID=A0A1V4IU54_9CLOT|nr:hypothetical protein [Clostridium oryzae]OPJ63552.1 hypothetical protein CLORY_10600 [Clostridium oryzae]